MHQIFSYPLVIDNTYIDFLGHVNNASYLTLFEKARVDLITKNGYGIQYIREIGLSPIILEIHLKFIKEIRAGDEIIIHTQLINYEKKIGRLKQQMLRNGELCCDAEFTFSLFDIKARKLIAPTEKWLNAIGYQSTENSSK